MKVIRITTVTLSLHKLLHGQLRFLQSNGFVVKALSSPGPEISQIERDENCEHISVNMTRSITPIKDMIALIKLVVIFLRESPDIVHTHTPKAGLLGMLAARLTGVPYRLHTVAGLPLLESTGLRRKMLNVVERITYLCATQVYPNSFGLKKIIMQESFCSEQKLKVIGNGSSNGIDTSFFSRDHFTSEDVKRIKNSWGITENDFVFIFIGRLVPDKGISELVEAFTTLSANYKNIKLLLVGPKESELYPLLPKTEELIEKNVSIISTGYQGDVRPFLAVSHALVFPSYREGFPNVVMQACSMELPAIVTDINGCNEIVEDRKNGLIVPPKNVDALMDAMKEIYSNTALYQTLKENARQMIVDRYEQRYVWQELLNEYKSLRKS